MTTLNCCSCVFWIGNSLVAYSRKNTCWKYCKGYVKSKYCRSQYNFYTFTTTLQAKLVGCSKDSSKDFTFSLAWVKLYTCTYSKISSSFCFVHSSWICAHWAWCCVKQIRDIFYYYLDNVGVKVIKDRDESQYNLTSLRYLKTTLNNNIHNNNNDDDWISWRNLPGGLIKFYLSIRFDNSL